MVNVELPKKAGGSRLIGLIISLVRIWAKGRYADLRETLEERFASPLFAAAPGRSAEQASLEMTLATEAAVGKGEEAASTLADLKQFYENIEVTDYAGGVLQTGVPLLVVALASHFYLGPRRLR